TTETRRHRGSEIFKFFSVTPCLGGEKDTTMATATVIPKTKIQGGSWLLEESSVEDIFTPEDFSEQHKLIAQTAEEFAQKEIIPNIEKMEHKDWAVVRELLRKASEIGI